MSALEKKFNDGVALGEAKANIAIVRKMLSEKLDVGLIQKCTGLSIQQIENLKSQI